jgi:hypothetical protein
LFQFYKLLSGIRKIIEAEDDEGKYCEFTEKASLIYLTNGTRSSSKICV